MSQPIQLPLPRSIPQCWIASVLTVDTVTHTCSLDIGDGNPLTEIVYFGRAPQVGEQVAMFMVRSTSFVLGGSG